jgi:hypothetical protein
VRASTRDARAIVGVALGTRHPVFTGRTRLF